MSLQESLEQFYARIHEANAAVSEQKLRAIFNGRGFTFDHRYIALKGICRAMELQGKWTESETVWTNLYAQLLREPNRPLLQQSQRPQPRQNRRCNPLWVAAGVIGLVFLLK